MGFKYSFDQQGGFYAYSESMRWAAYAYPSSTYGEMAKRNPSLVLAYMTKEALVEEDLGMAARSVTVRESMDRMLAMAVSASLARVVSR